MITTAAKNMAKQNLRRKSFENDSRNSEYWWYLRQQPSEEQIGTTDAHFIDSQSHGVTFVFFFFVSAAVELIPVIAK